MINSNPELRLPTRFGELSLRPDNTSLVSHVEEYDIFDHVYVQVDSGERPSGVYIFGGTKVFDGISRYLIANGYPHQDLNDVADKTRAAFIQVVRPEDLYVPDTI